MTKCVTNTTQSCAGCLTCILEKDLVHVGGGILEKLVVRVEDDDGNLAVAEDRQLVGLLHQAELALGEGHLGGNGRVRFYLPRLEIPTTGLPGWPFRGQK